MHYTISTTLLPKESQSALVIIVFEEGIIDKTAKQIDKLSQGYLTKLFKQGDFKGQLEESLLLLNQPGLPSRLLLIGGGKKTELTENNFRKIILASINKLKTLTITHAQFNLTSIAITKRDLTWKIRYAVQLIANNLYCFNEFKTKLNGKTALTNIAFYIENTNQKKLAQTCIVLGQAFATGMITMKNLANLPANVCTPAYLAEQTKKIFQHDKKCQVTIFDEKTLQKMGMNTILAVGQGSTKPPRLITIEYNGGKKAQQPIALVGKGITFDTGGASLKPADGMINMKFDMSGGAAVIGTIKAAIELNLPLNIVGVIAAAENMIGGNAVKPSDIVTTYSGQTVEIINTDAEGRLVLCDALTYCQKFNPEIVIDIATLTGAVRIALGPHACALFSNDDDLRADLFAASQQSQDHAWPMPIYQEYQANLDSAYADMMNIGSDNYAGSIMATCFLARFTSQYTWAHLDIAAIAYNQNGREKGSSGRPVPLLLQYLLNRV
jgi:leucyl aminopeptidase